MLPSFFRVVLGLSFTGLVILTSLLILLPDSAAACGELTCVCGIERNTGMVWEMGPTCGEALQTAVNVGRSRFACSGDVCSETVVIDTPCWLNGSGEYQVDLHILYKCEECSYGTCL